VAAALIIPFRVAKGFLPSLGDYDELLARNRGASALVKLRFAKGFNHEDTKDTKAVTKNFEIQVFRFVRFLRESFGLFAPLWLNGLPPRGDLWRGSRFQSLRFGMKFFF
jgi:hypothetical protein